MSESQHTVPVEYRPIEGFPGYRVGDDGTVQSNRTRGGRVVPWRNMSLLPDGTDRLYVGLRRGDKIHRRQVHQLVLEAFVGPCPDGLEGCHGNGNHRDNRACNLRWDTHRANCGDTVRHGRSTKGTRNAAARLDDARVSEIRRRYAAKEAYQYQFAQQFGVGQSTIHRIISRKCWRHLP